MSKRPGDPGYPANWCIHFRSMGKYDTCEKGVRFDSFKGADAKMDRMPCFTTPVGVEKAPCEHRRVPTQEEVVAHKEWVRGQTHLLGTVMIGILPWREKWQGRNHHEVVECPACKGRLHLSIAGSRSHVHGRCETVNCVSWME